MTNKWDNALPVPDYSDEPTLIIGFGDDGIFGVEAVGFELPEVRLIARDYERGPLHEDDLAYEDSEV